MDKSTTLNVLKNAFMIEKKGMNLYLKVIENTDNEDAKTFFRDMADEEKVHMEMIEKQFKAYAEKGKFLEDEYGAAPDLEAPVDILNESLIKKISAAGFEATAITASIAFEQRAVELYSKRAESATDPEEKKMYKWLASWEKTHLEKLQQIDRALTEQVWFDEGFWPF